MPDNGNGLTYLEIEKKAKKMYKDGKITYKQYMLIHHKNVKNMQNLKNELIKKVNELEAEKLKKEEGVQSDPQEVSDTPM